MKKFAAALVLSTAAAGAFATNVPPGCRETPQYPNGTPECFPTTPTTPPVVVTTPVTVNTPVTVKTPVTVNAPVSVKTPVTVNTPVSVTDNSEISQTATADATASVVDKSQNNSGAAATGNVTTIDNHSRYRAAAHAASPNAASIVSDGSCKTGISVATGVGTVDVTVGGSIAFNTGWSEECAAHEVRKLELQSNIVREQNLRASGNPVDSALAHEQAIATSPAYREGTKMLRQRIETLGGNSQNPFEARQGDARLMGLNVVVRKPVQTTILAPAPASVAVAPSPNVNVSVYNCAATNKAPAAARTMTTAPATAVSTGCSAAEIAAALAAEQAKKTAPVGVAKP